jgi:cell division protein FtsB
MRPRAIVVISASAALVVVVWATLAPGALPHLTHMRAEQRALLAETEALALENARLRADARALRGDDAASLLLLEKVVRDELGYLRADEVVLLPRAAVVPKEGTPP